MLVGILSDTHDNLTMIRRALSFFEGAGADCLIHAGDFVAPFALREIVKYKGVVYAVFGNNDGERVGLRKVLPDLGANPLRIDLCGKVIVVAHDEAQLKASDRKGADVIVVGHTHKAEIRLPSGGLNGRTGQSQTAGQSLPKAEVRAGQPIVVNPGEAGGWLTGEATVAMLDTETLDVRIVKLGDCDK